MKVTLTGAQRDKVVSLVKITKAADLYNLDIKGKRLPKNLDQELVVVMHSHKQAMYYGSGGQPLLYHRSPEAAIEKIKDKGRACTAVVLGYTWSETDGLTSLKYETSKKACTPRISTAVLLTDLPGFDLNVHAQIRAGSPPPAPPTAEVWREGLSSLLTSVLRHRDDTRSGCLQVQRILQENAELKAINYRLQLANAEMDMDRAQREATAAQQKADDAAECVHKLRQEQL